MGWHKRQREGAPPRWWGRGGERRHDMRRKTTSEEGLLPSKLRKSHTWQSCVGAGGPQVVQGRARARGSLRLGSRGALSGPRLWGGQAPTKDSTPGSHSPQDLHLEMGRADLKNRYWPRSVSKGKDRTMNRGQVTCGWGVRSACSQGSARGQPGAGVSLRPE